MSDALPDGFDLQIDEADEDLPGLPDLPSEALDMPPALLAVLAALAALASLALFARWLARRRRRRIEAGNQALKVLARQHACFVATRAAFRDAPTDPAPPTFDAIAPQLQDLSFLFDARGIPAVLRLIEAQQRHARLAELVRMQRDCRYGAERGEQAAAASAAARRNLSEALAADEGAYEQAFDHLRGELVRRYGERFVRLDAGG